MVATSRKPTPANSESASDHGPITALPSSERAVEAGLDHAAERDLVGHGRSVRERQRQPIPTLVVVRNDEQQRSEPLVVDKPPGLVDEIEAPVADQACLAHLPGIVRAHRKPLDRRGRDPRDGAGRVAHLPKDDASTGRYWYQFAR